MNRKLGFIGAGNMGTALVGGIIKAGILSPGNIYIYDIDETKAGALEKEMGIKAVESNEELIIASDIIIIAVKPNMVKTVLDPLKKLFDSTKILVSIAAGVSIKTFKEILGERSKVVRTMPNTPALISEGVTLLSPDSNITDTDISDIKSIFECVGKVDLLEEKLMNEVIAVTSSSPAYVFLFIEAMADAAVQSGIPRNLAYRLAAQAVQGSARMVLETGKHPGELKDQVCSPAGTTIEAVAALEKFGFRSAVIEAMRECTRRAREIGKSN